MSEKVFFRLSGLAAVVSAGLSFFTAIAVVLSSLSLQISGSIINLLLIITNLFIVFALIGFYGVQQKEIGTQGLVGFVLSVIGILSTFLVPLVGHLIFLLGLLLYAITNGRNGSLPKSAMWLWFSGAFVAVTAGVLSFGVLMALGLVISASGRAWLGTVVWLGRGGEPSPQVSF
ncbi:MAG: hypothetical protein PVG32_06380 [Anaerolineales bacterium]|jgi:hypothetical protein